MFKSKSFNIVAVYYKIRYMIFMGVGFVNVGNQMRQCFTLRSILEILDQRSSSQEFSLPIQMKFDILLVSLLSNSWKAWISL